MNQEDIKILNTLTKGNLFDTVKDLIAPSLELAGSMILCTCAIHKQIRHMNCIKDPLTNDLHAWIGKNMWKNLLDESNIDNYYKSLAFYVSERTIVHLEAHIPDFGSTQDVD